MHNSWRFDINTAVQRQNAVTKKTVILQEKQKTNFLQLKQYGAANDSLVVTSLFVSV